jgi:GSPII_E N-terminal domain.
VVYIDSSLNYSRDFNIKDVDIKILKLIPEDFAFKNNVLPYKFVDGTIYIAAIKCEDIELISRLRLICKTNIKLTKMG